MRAVLSLSLFASLSLAQTPVSPQPPADVDRALRARITAFYDLLVNHQYRRAEELVAPDSRDIYYEREKPRYLGYELTSIAYSGEFTRADVVVTIKMPPTSALIPVPMNTPLNSIWRLLDGAWYWTIPKINVTDLLKTMTGGEPASPDAKAAAIPSPMPSNGNLPGGLGRPESIPMMGLPETAGAPQFSIDRAVVTLKQSTTEKAAITNTSSAPITLFLLGTLPGIKATFDHPRVNPGEKAVLSIHAAEGAKDGVLVIGVTETRAMMSLPVNVK